jgi:ATP-binding cassette subfamily B protein
MPGPIRLLTTRFADSWTQLRYLPPAFALIWSAAPRWTVAWMILLVAQGLLPVSIVYLTRTLVNSLVTAMQAGGDWSSLRPVLLSAGLMFGILLLTEALRGATRWIRTAQGEQIKDHISTLIHAKAASLDMAFYETPEYYDRLHRARVDALSRPVTLLENSGSLVQNGITLAAMAAVLVAFGPWLPMALVVSTLPALYVVLRYTLLQHERRRRLTPVERRAGYYDWILTSRESAAELRLFGLAAHFQNAYRAVRGTLQQEQVQLAKHQGMAEILASVVASLTTGAAMAWMLWRASHGLVTLGDLAFFYQAFSQGQRLMRTLLDNVGQVYGSGLFLSNLFELLALEPQVVDPPRLSPVPVRLERGIRFWDVTFRYPGSSRTAMMDFNLTVPVGQIVAIVGPNGAGKSTLIKLLCRFYDPTLGRIELDGIDLRELPIEGLRGLITVLFQEPVRYNATVSENIGLGDLAHCGGADIESAAKAAGADSIIARLPAGYETALGKWFGGAELSMGEWQRLALARAFLRQAPIIVLDEPTSAMDSWAEADWMRRFRTLAAGRTAIIVTHRLTTAMQADMIHVMEEGRIVESGSHDALLALGIRYAQSWDAQMIGK